MFIHRLMFAPLLIAATAALAAQAPAPTAVSVHVDLSKPVGDFKSITGWFGYDELNYTTTPNGRQLLAELHDAYPVPVYIRAHHLFTSGDGKPALKWSSTSLYSVDSHGKPVYDFHIIDQTFDAWRDAGVRPMVELGFMPEALASGTEPYYLAYPHTIEGSVQSPPKDYAAWRDLCRVFTAHLVQRYGRDAVAQWYFEVWNEPNIRYWHGTESDYLKLYDYAVSGVRSALPTARVGGPATTSPRSKQAADYLDAFLHHVANDPSAADGKPVPLDFITFHAKGTPRLIKSPDGTSHVRMGLNSELTDADKGFALIASYPQFRPLPIILSEADPEGCAACSAIENPANGYRNGPLYPAYTAATMKGLFDLQDKYKVNLLGMLSWSFEFEDRKYFEGFRTLATNGVDKPVLNLFRMAGLMGAQRVAATSSSAVPAETIMANGVHDSVDIDALATLSADSTSVLLWNYRDDDLPDAPPSGIQIEIVGIPANVHRVLLQHYRIDQTHSNAFTTWKAMGSPQAPTPQQYADLRAAGQLELLDSPQWVDIHDGHITLSTTLPAQATSLLHLNW
jgi:xylan 1,4-beta-xylosidase